MLQISSAHEVRSLVTAFLEKPGDLKWLNFINALNIELKDQMNHPKARSIADEWIKITSPIFSSYFDCWRLNIPIAHSSLALVTKPARYSASVNDTELISFDSMLANAKLRMKSTNGQLEIFNQRFYYQYCIICKQVTQDGWSDIVVRNGSPMKGSWYNFYSEESDGNEIQNFTINNFDSAGVFWRLLGTCGRGARCNPFCLSCDSRVGPALSLALLESFSEEHFCVNCTMRGLVSVQPPKPNLHELRLYREKFSRKEK